MLWELVGGPKEKVWNTPLAEYKQWCVVSVCLSLGHRTEAEPRPLVIKVIVRQLLACPSVPTVSKSWLEKMGALARKADLTILTSSSHRDCPLNHIYEHRLM